jgi:transposase
MARPKSKFTEELAERAEADLESLGKGGIARKLHAISAAARHPLATVADVAGVARQTVLRWAEAYRERGLDGLRPRAGGSRPPRLDTAQKAAVLSWVDAQRTAGGEAVHWTLERLSMAVAEAFGVSLTPSAVWLWLRAEGRKPKVPRPRHHLADAAAQEAFKKKRGS